MKHRFQSRVTGVFLSLVFAFLPLFYTDYYYNIQLSKSSFFIVCAYTAFLFSVPAAFCRRKEAGQKQEEPRILRITALFALLFLCWAALSALFSGDLRASLTGSGGRYTGFLWLTACVIGFFAGLRSSGKQKRRSAFIFVSSAGLVSLIGLCHGFGVDIGGFLQHVPEKFTRMYLSTVGYINFFAQLLSFGLAVATALFCLDGKLWLLPLIFLLDLGLLLGNSDAAILGYGVTVLLFPLLTAKNREQLSRLFLSLIPFPLAAVVLKLVYPHLIGYPAVSTLCGLLFKLRLSLILLVISAAVFALLRFAWKAEIPKPLFRVYGFLLLAAAAALAVLFAAANTGLWENSVFTISDSWGSNRGFVWRKILELYAQSGAKRKLLGYGPDSLLTLMNAFCHDESIAVTTQVFDSAHNDFLQYLITLGLPGALLYSGFFASALTAGLRTGREESRVWLMLLICYLAQAFLVPIQPMTTPFAYLSAGLAASGVSQGDGSPDS